MKKIVLLLFVFALFPSCEDVVEIDLNTSDPKLVIEASVNLLEDGTSNSTVKLTLTAPFFDNQIPTVDDATVMITGDDGINYPFNHNYY